MNYILYLLYLVSTVSCIYDIPEMINVKIAIFAADTVHLAIKCNEIKKNTKLCRLHTYVGILTSICFTSSTSMRQEED